MDANVTFIHVALSGTIFPSALSLPTLLHHVLGVNGNTAERAVVLVIPIGLIALVLLRKHPRAAFAVAILTATYASPVVLPGNLVLLLAIATPGRASRAAVATDADDPAGRDPRAIYDPAQ